MGLPTWYVHSHIDTRSWLVLFIFLLVAFMVHIVFMDFDSSKSTVRWFGWVFFLPIVSCLVTAYFSSSS